MSGKIVYPAMLRDPYFPLSPDYSETKPSFLLPTILNFLRAVLIILFKNIGTKKTKDHRLSIFFKDKREI